MNVNNVIAINISERPCSTSCWISTKHGVALGVGEGLGPPSSGELDACGWKAAQDGEGEALGVCAIAGGQMKMNMNAADISTRAGHALCLRAGLRRRACGGMGTAFTSRDEERRDCDRKTGPRQ